MDAGSASGCRRKNGVAVMPDDWIIEERPESVPGCKVGGCDKSACNKRGWCWAHYQRWRKHGDPLGGGTPLGEALRFLQGTALTWQDREACLTWPYGQDGKGYGRVQIDGKQWVVSRYVCEKEHGPPPTAAHEAAHTCGKGHEGCINRWHMRWATPKENSADTFIHGTNNCGERHGNAKLTEGQAAAILALKDRVSHSEAARRFGVSKSNVHHIWKGRGWKHVTRPNGTGTVEETVKLIDELDDEFLATAGF